MRCYDDILLVRVKTSISTAKKVRKSTNSDPLLYIV